MADSQQVERPAVVSQAKRNSYLRHVQIHIELLQDSLQGREFGCGAGQGDRDAIEQHLLEMWNIISAAELAVVDLRPPRSGRGGQSGKVIPLRPRPAA